MQKHKPLLVALSIAIAVIVPLLNAMKVKMDRASYPIVKFDIEPYDPRDLLYGHYMNFAITWNWKGGKPDDKACIGNECCLCVGEGDSNPQVFLLQCFSPSSLSCKHKFKGYYYSGGTFTTDITRVFVDERIALPLEEIFRRQKEKFSIGLGMAPDGKHIIERLYIGGKPVDQYVDEKGGSLTSSEDEPTTP